MEFDGRFLFFALILPFAAETFQQFVNVWLYYLAPSASALLPWSSLAWAPISLGLSILLPFGVMYFLGTKVTDLGHYRAVLPSIFVGCWVGEAAAMLFGAFVMYQLGGSYGADPVLATVYILWGLLTSAVSPSLFISLAAALLAYYNRSVHSIQPTATA